ncbi:TNF receptor-associated factor 4-like isoform X2 [Halichondria panicea]|uniref:TNF receptor-associated factor 4-like isoform X2 n=1 Tax=Halichondria panicea TaxID=6063 RepID=UPI00312B5609
MATFSGGYDNDFADQPPKSLECSICLLTLRNPMVISCCGNHYCEACIGRITNNRKPCPLCNSPDFTTFLHKGVAREVNALRVYCLKKAQGCDWQGELGQVDRHLNPAANSRGCGFVLVECKYRCGEKFERRAIASHEADNCAKRPIEMQMAFLARRLEMLATENRDIKTKMTVLDAEVSTLKSENTSLKQQIEARPLPPVPPFYFTMDNYQQCKEESRTITSPPFYSHPKGYKMRLDIYTNGFMSALNTHVTLFIFILRGEFDGILQWPFTGRVTIDMYNIKLKQWTQTRVVDFKDTPVERKCDRLTSGSCGYNITQDQVAECVIKDGTHHTHACFRIIEHRK